MQLATLLRAGLLSVWPLVVSAQSAQGVVETRNAAGVPTQQNRQAAAPAETKPEDLASLEGQVLDALTGEPLRKANLVLRATDIVPNGAAIPTGYSTASDLSGKFAIGQVEPGRYRLTVNRTGYTSGEYGATAPGRQGTTLALSRAQKLTGLALKLTPHGVVTGRIVDRDGDPLAAVQIQLLRYRYLNGKKQLSFSNANSTNDLGEYRIYGVAPGRYYVLATYRTNQFDIALDRSLNPDEDFAPTYYPGAFDISSANEVTVTAGGQLRVDLTLTKTRTARISGQVINTAAPAAVNTSVMLTARGGMLIGPMINRSTVGGPSGSFDLRSVPPGAYYLVASASFASKTYVARQAIDVSTGNIQNLTLTIGPGVEINGRVHLEGATSTAPASLQVALRPREMGIQFGPTPVASLKEDGSFKLADVSPDNYNLFFQGLPEGTFVKSIRSGDVDILTNGLDLISGAPGVLDIVLSPSAGQATGTVQNPKTQQPVPGATVVLIPTERERLDQQTYYKTATTDQSGNFTLKSLVPGEYKAYAWDDLESGAYFDPDFMRPFEGKGEKVSVVENTQLNLQLTLLATDGSGQPHQ